MTGKARDLHAVDEGPIFLPIYKLEAGRESLEGDLRNLNWWLQLGSGAR